MKEMDVWKAFSILHQKTKVTVQTYLKIKTLKKVQIGYLGPCENKKSHSV